MAKAFSVASWNVEHFGATKKSTSKPTKPVEPIIDYLASHNADVVAIYEVVGKVAFESLVRKMPQYQFHITEGPQSQEILVGVKKTKTAFFTQKNTFKSGASALRPGALLTIVEDGEYYPLLFLHLKSISSPKGFGLRDDMTQRAINFRKHLIKNDPDEISNFIYLGDLNTMGMNISYSDKDISGLEEIERLKKRHSIKSVKMNLLEKNATATYWPGTNSDYDPSDLDHVMAADHLKFKSFGNSKIDVRGWVEESTDASKDSWAKKFSDHALLYFEVQKV